MRVEGENWNAYYAIPNVIEGAVRLGSLRAALVDQSERQPAFMDMMPDIASENLESFVGVRTAWPNPPYPAPEHERASNSLG
jgi:hypothetical protein